MGINRQIIFLLFIFTVFSISSLNAQEEIVPYEKKLSISMGGGPTLMGIDYGIQLENQFVLEVGRFFSISAAYGGAHAYQGMDNVKREYSPEPDLITETDFTRDQSLFYARMGFEITPLNTKYHRAFVGIGPSLNFYNFSGGSVISTADTTIFLLSNRHKTVFSYSFFGGYDIFFKEHYLVGFCFYFVNYQKDPMYGILVRAGYKF